MSALTPKADMCGALAHVCFGPKADIASTPLHSIDAGPYVSQPNKKPRANGSGLRSSDCDGKLHASPESVVHTGQDADRSRFAAE